MRRGKILYQYDSGDELLTIERNVEGNYIFSIDQYAGGLSGQMIIPPAKADELRIVLMPSYEPERYQDLIHDAASLEPPHPDD